MAPAAREMNLREVNSVNRRNNDLNNILTP